jgi:AcrR family transcriptional regulator
MDGSTSRDEILDVAIELIDREGADALSMRNLAAKLDVAVTAIYHHVGNRRQLEDALLDRILERALPIRTTGRTPERRVLSTAQSLLVSIREHKALMGFAQRHGRLSRLSAPAREAIAAAFTDAGLRRRAAADATDAVIMLVAEHAIAEFYATRWPAQEDADVRRQPDPDHMFDVALGALVRGLLAGAARIR